MPYVMTTTDFSGNKMFIHQEGFWVKDSSQARVYPELVDFISESIFGTEIKLEALDIEAAHGEALKMNEALKSRAHARQYSWFNVYSYKTRAFLLERYHDEALAMNVQFDALLETHFSNEIGRTHLLNDRQINFVLNVMTPDQYSPAQGDL